MVGKVKKGRFGSKKETKPNQTNWGERRTLVILSTITGKINIFKRKRIL